MLFFIILLCASFSAYANVPGRDVYPGQHVYDFVSVSDRPWVCVYDAVRGEGPSTNHGSRLQLRHKRLLHALAEFTSKERDAETGLDYFGARYMSSAQGRFTSPDPLLGSGRPEDPQSWNRYAYGFNNPLRFIDPSGLDPISVEDCQKNSECTVVKVNVVIDRNSSVVDKKGNLLPEFQKKLDGQLAQAADEYGNAQVSFDVSYSSGTVSRRSNGSYNVTGAVDNALNVAVTDSDGFGSYGKGVSFVGDGGRSFSLINAGQSEQNTIAHEYTHHFTGNVRLPGVAAFFYNPFADFNNDAGRALLRNWDSPAVRVLRAIDPLLGQRQRAIGQYGRQWFAGGAR